jgi:hypothetical protein
MEQEDLLCSLLELEEGRPLPLPPPPIPAAVEEADASKRRALKIAWRVSLRVTHVIYWNLDRDYFLILSGRGSMLTLLCDSVWVSAVLRVRLWPCNGRWYLRVCDHASVQKQGGCSRDHNLPTAVSPATRLDLRHYTIRQPAEWKNKSQWRLPKDASNGRLTGYQLTVAMYSVYCNNLYYDKLCLTSMMEGQGQQRAFGSY